MECICFREWQDKVGTWLRRIFHRSLRKHHVHHKDYQDRFNGILVFEILDDI